MRNSSSGAANANRMFPRRAGHHILAAGLALWAAFPAAAGGAAAARRVWSTTAGQAAALEPRGAVLTQDQSAAFRAWFVSIVAEQLRAGPSPRWTQRDCAGLVRHAAREALRPHDAKWLRANGFAGRPLPPEVGLDAGQAARLSRWRLPGGERGDFAPAIGIVADNSVFVGTDLNAAQPGDLLFFDQGADQHLMVWTGAYAAYHNGARAGPGSLDSGLRAATPRELGSWPDTRWRPSADNPNFAGVFRLAFLP